MESLQGEKLLAYAIALVEAVSRLGYSLAENERYFLSNAALISEYLTKAECRKVSQEYLAGDIIEPEELLVYAVGFCFEFFMLGYESPIREKLHMIFLKLSEIYMSYSREDT